MITFGKEDDRKWELQINVGKLACTLMNAFVKYVNTYVNVVVLMIMKRRIDQIEINDDVR